MDATALTGALSESFLSLSGDVLILLGIFVISLVFTTLKGKSKLVAILLSLYLTGFILLFFPFWELLLSKIPLEAPQLKALVFLLGIFISFLAVAQIILARYPENFLEKFFQMVLLSFFTTALFFFFAYRIIPLPELYPLSPQLEMILGSPLWFFWSLVLPLVSIYFTDRDEFV
ncbi:MAG: hypothetical protein WD003_00725 [Candidatus Paceibacterota bacterium]